MKTLINIGKSTALLSLAIGTLLLVIYVFFNIESVLILGYFYTIVATAINSIIFLFLLIFALINSRFRFELLKTCGIMLLNIPFAILYIYIAFSFI